MCVCCVGEFEEIVVWYLVVLRVVIYDVVVDGDLFECGVGGEVCDEE